MDFFVSVNFKKSSVYHRFRWRCSARLIMILVGVGVLCFVNEKKPRKCIFSSIPVLRRSEFRTGSISLEIQTRGAWSRWKGTGWDITNQKVQLIFNVYTSVLTRTSRSSDIQHPIFHRIHPDLLERIVRPEPHTLFSGRPWVFPDLCMIHISWNCGSDG